MRVNLPVPKSFACESCGVHKFGRFELLTQPNQLSKAQFCLSAIWCVLH
jgi:hypothetical protein